jgi:hypothetical protein
MKAVLSAIKAARKAGDQMSAAMLKEYPQGADVRWKKHGIQEGVVLWNPAPGHRRIKVHNRRTGKDVWITAYHIAEAQGS